MISRPKLVRIGYWIVTAYVAFTALMIHLGNTHFRSRFVIPVALFCLISLFVVIPIATIVLFLLNRKCRKEHARWQRVFMLVACVLFLYAWLFSCLPIVIISGFIQPWPLTLRHGPDTNYAREGFTKHAGFAPPSTVSRIYYRKDSWWLDIRYRLRFQVSDPAVVQSVVRHQMLAESEEQKTGLTSTYRSRAPKWWKEKMGKREIMCYFREKGGNYWYLWYEPETGTVWYEEYVD